MKNKTNLVSNNFNRDTEIFTILVQLEKIAITIKSLKLNNYTLRKPNVRSSIHYEYLNHY